MAVIQKIEASKRVPGRYLVWLGEKELLRVTADELLAFQLCAGRELTEEEVQSITQAGQASGVRATAARMVGAKPMSRGELLERLRKKGASEEDAADAAGWLEELGALNDGAYAALVVRHYSRKGYGEKKLREELWRRRVPQALWPEALSQAEDAGEAVERLIAQRLKGRVPDERELGRLQSYLLRRGYSWSQVREGLSRIGGGETEW